MQNCNCELCEKVGRQLTDRQHEQCRKNPKLVDALRLAFNRPNCIQRATNAASAVGRVVKATAKRQRVKASPEVIEQRREICQACPERDGDWCQQRRCGCFLPLKSTLTTESCPLGKWPGHE